MITNNVNVAMFSILAICLVSTVAPAADTVALIEEPITPIPLRVELDQNKVILGEMLFNDVRLSKDNSMACASCHQLTNGGDDNLTVAVTTSANSTGLNTPTIFNTRFNFRQNWDGSAENLVDHIEKKVSSQRDIDTDWETILSRISAENQYIKHFNNNYPDGITKSNFLDALTEFERSLITPNARFDQYLRGDSNAITAEEKQGYTLFKKYGCISCHQGINIGGNLFEKFGIFYNYFEKRGDITTADYGRQNITHRLRDKYVFKVPTLRNIEHTAPYFHDGKTLSLGNAILIMGQTQLGVTINNKDIIMIEKFLKTLTGEYKGIPPGGGQS